MSADVKKIEGKIEVTNLIAADFEKLQDSAVREAARCEGGTLWLRRSILKTVPSVHQRIDKDFAEGKLDLSQFESPAQLASLMKHYVTLVAEGLENLARKAESETLVNNGKVVALRASADLIGRYQTSAEARMTQINSPPENPDIADDRRALRAERRERRRNQDVEPDAESTETPEPPEEKPKEEPKKAKKSEAKKKASKKPANNKKTKGK